MKHSAREWQFHFTVETFNLAGEEIEDPERVAWAREQEERMRARRDGSRARDSNSFFRATNNQPERTVMGYCMEQVTGKFKIPVAKFPEALAAIKSLQPGAWTGEQFRVAATLPDALHAWRWLPSIEDSGIVALGFNGEKLGDDDRLFSAIAPFVEAGSFIEMMGEDGTSWRWVFDGKTCKEQKSRLVWERI